MLKRCGNGPIIADSKMQRTAGMDKFPCKRVRRQIQVSKGISELFDCILALMEESNNMDDG